MNPNLFRLAPMPTSSRLPPGDTRCQHTWDHVPVKTDASSTDASLASWDRITTSYTTRTFLTSLYITIHHHRTVRQSAAGQICVQRIHPPFSWAFTSLFWGHLLYSRPTTLFLWKTYHSGPEWYEIKMSVQKNSDHATSFHGASGIYCKRN